LRGSNDTRSRLDGSVSLVLCALSFVSSLRFLCVLCVSAVNVG
jgi:hypothetical protein